MIPTTFEMDKLLTQEDIDNRFFVMKPCIPCGKYTKQDVRVRETKPCAYCYENKFSIASNQWASLRSWNPTKRLSAAERKKMGA